MMKRVVSSFRKAQGATASVEMALMLPILFALMFTTFEAGYYLWMEHKVIKGVRDGARFAARQDSEYYLCGNSAIQDPTTPGLMSKTALAKVIGNITRTGRVEDDQFPRVPGWYDQPTIIVGCNTSYNSGLYNGKTGAPFVTVSAVVTYPSILGRLGIRFGPLRLRAQSQAVAPGG